MKKLLLLALAKAKSFKLDLILLDYVMREKDDGDVMNEFRADPGTKDNPVIGI